MRKVAAVLLSLAAAASLSLVTSGTANASADGILVDTAEAHNLCATPKGGSTANGTIVTTWSCTGSSLQRWSYSNGYLKNLTSGKCLTPSGGQSGTDGTVLTLWTCTNDSSQAFVADNNGSMYTMYGGKCITNKGDSMSDGVYLTLWHCASPIHHSQWWEVL
ncbi:RICIN domain-containing protein [Streptomyces mirabilis]|uniref:Ricin-type beta-trefoil lectin domain protein n=1 Tax=Streptomyces mirabilis TaxID=68239 RepID=A0ABU3UQG8_9ACTN|nr:ricin-type beta-trefoil lectin domain protein [Streptomyces mirabilis]MCX4610156.1 ricin-type beta-trefoil lectin domain protein [Streptomyces mirabilis]MDU8996167.1 ricin-type beta-trefoil lectin domain protein [Streptomyces mirabilis]